MDQHQQWLDWRRGGIGASDVGIIMGVAPKGWGTLYSLWADKVYGIGKKDNAAMQHGRETEAEARAWLEKETGLIFEANPRKENPLYPWQRCTPDCWNADHKFMAEIKCPLNSDDHLYAISGIVPPKYYPQVQYQMKVLEVDTNHYTSYYKKQGIYFNVNRDDRLIKQMMPKLEEFWDMVVSKKAPPMVDEDHLIMEENETWKEVMQRCFSIRNKKKEIETEEKILRDFLVKKTAGKNAKCRQYEMTRSECSGRIDYDQAIHDYCIRLKELYPDINFPSIPFEAYRGEVFTKWTIRDI